MEVDEVQSRNETRAAMLVRKREHARRVIEDCDRELQVAADAPQQQIPDAETLLEEGLNWARNGEGGAFEELLTWWRDTCEGDAQRTIPKAIEYGSIDLNIIGFALGECIPTLKEQRREGSTEAAEMGIAFYLLGKIARMVSAYSEGQAPSDDTWMDVTVYSMMGRRVRDRGSWG
jgi:hypothetical protein